MRPEAMPDGAAVSAVSTAADAPPVRLRRRAGRRAARQTVPARRAAAYNRPHPEPERRR
ncbi:MAG: hypothetical protein O9972_56260 [Burkholderiales bacterium]|nr:hypothetical protein [Burkholderiales bacterium]